VGICWICGILVDFGGLLVDFWWIFCGFLVDFWYGLGGALVDFQRSWMDFRDPGSHRDPAGPALPGPGRSAP
jgi:hypothetical protein